jgi:hypothetical protein
MTKGIRYSFKSAFIYSGIAIAAIGAARLVDFSAASPQQNLPATKQGSSGLSGAANRPAGVAASPANRWVANYGRLPLGFEANEGQTDERVKFLSRGRGYSLFLTGDEAVLTLEKTAVEAPTRTRSDMLVRTANARVAKRPPFSAAALPDLLSLSTPKRESDNEVERPRDRGAGPALPFSSRRLADSGENSTVLRMRLVGANASAAVTGAEELPGKSNYFIGNDPKKWRTNVPNYARVKYQNVYAGVDLVYHGNQGGQLEYDFVVAPGADPSQIKLGFAGADGMSVDGASGDLVVKVGDEYVRLQKPVVYQPAVAVVSSAPYPSVTPAYGPDVRHSLLVTLHSSFVLVSNNEAAFRVAGYDPKRVLVIDPVLSYSTFLGGGYGKGMAVDAAGNAYVTGAVGSGFPTTTGAFQAACGGGCAFSNAFVAKLNPSGSALVYSTYLGGSHGDFGNTIVVDSVGDAYVTGYTDSTDFPTLNPLQAAAGGGTCLVGLASGPCGDAFVTKLNTTGSALVFSTYLGGNGDDQALGIALDSADNVYVTGGTTGDFPTTTGVFQPTFSGNATCQLVNIGCGNAFVAKMNATGSALVYSTYLGGSGNDTGRGIAVDSAGNAYVAGGTRSSNFPTTAGVVQPSFGGPTAPGPYFGEDPLNYSSGDAFVAKLNATGSALVYSTFLGGNNDDFGTGIALDSAGEAYIIGTTISTDFPTSGDLQPAAGGGTCANGFPCSDAFVAKLNGAGSTLIYSTYLGGSANDLGNAIAVDSAGNAYFAGQTFSANFPTTSGAFQNALAGDSNAFMAKINDAGSELIYSTYLGGSADDQGLGIAVDSASNAYVTGYTASTNFPTTPGALNTTVGGGFVIMFEDLAPAVVVAPGSLTFLSQLIGTTSTAQAVALTNNETSALTIDSITASGDFSQVNTCGTSLAAGVECTINVKFTPTTSGARTGSLTITDNAPGSPQTVSLSGTGSATQDFTLTASSGSSTSATAERGTSATYTLSVAGEAGFNQSVSFTCTGAPSEATCTVSPNPITVGSSATNVTVTVATTAPSASAPRSRPLPPVPPLSPGLRRLWMLALALALMAWTIARRNQPRMGRWRSTMVPLVSGLLLTLALAGCGGGGSGKLLVPPPNSGTPAGNYTLTVTGTAGSGSSALSHSVTLKLSVS